MLSPSCVVTQDGCLTFVCANALKLDLPKKAFLEDEEHLNRSIILNNIMETRPR